MLLLRSRAAPKIYGLTGGDVIPHHDRTNVKLIFTAERTAGISMHKEATRRRRLTGSNLSFRDGSTAGLVK